MRTRTVAEWRRIGVYTRYIVRVLTAVGLSVFFVIAEEYYQYRSAPAHDLDSFDSEQSASKRSFGSTELSDGRFDLLDASWKRGVHELIDSATCDQYDIELAITGGDNVGFLLAKAQAIVESGCQSGAVGRADDVGLNQVRSVACAEAKVEGDRTDPFINSLCAAGYRKVLCRTYKACPTLAAMYVAYNRGPTGASRVQDHKKTEYVRKIDYVLRTLIGSTRT